jgi:hypothetical protein
LFRTVLCVSSDSISPSPLNSQISGIAEEKIVTPQFQQNEFSSSEPEFLFDLAGISSLLEAGPGDLGASEYLRFPVMIENNHSYQTRLMNLLFQAHDYKGLAFDNRIACASDDPCRSHGTGHPTCTGCCLAAEGRASAEE